MGMVGICIFCFFFPLFLGGYIKFIYIQFSPPSSHVIFKTSICKKRLPHPPVRAFSPTAISRMASDWNCAIVVERRSVRRRSWRVSMPEKRKRGGIVAVVRVGNAMS